VLDKVTQRLAWDENPAIVGGHGVDVVDGRSRLQAEFDNTSRARKIESRVPSRAYKDSWQYQLATRFLEIVAAGFGDAA
jgi:hypothetical protein